MGGCGHQSVDSIIRVTEEKIGIFGCFGANIVRRTCATSLALQYREGGQAIAEGLDHGSSVIGRYVVDHEDLPLEARVLRPECRQLLADQCRCVERRDDDAHDRFRSRSPLVAHPAILARINEPSNLGGFTTARLRQRTRVRAPSSYGFRRMPCAAPQVQRHEAASAPRRSRGRTPRAESTG